MKKYTMLALAGSLLFTLAPLASAASDDSMEAALEKCDALSGLEQRWCIRNNSQLRRHDIQAQYQGARLDTIEEQRTFMLQQRDERRELRLQFYDTIHATDTAPNEKSDAIRSLKEKRQELTEEQKSERKEFRQGIRSRLDELKIGERNTRRAFRQNANAIAAERRRMLLEQNRYEFHQEPLLPVDEEEDENEDDEVESGTGSTPNEEEES